MSSLNPLNYSLGELKKALVGGLVGAAVTAATVFSTSGVPQTAPGWTALLSTLLGAFVVSFVAVFLPKNDSPVAAPAETINTAWAKALSGLVPVEEALKQVGINNYSSPPVVPEGTEVEPDPTSSDEFPPS
jgi:uncharacterized membrane protein YeaQ/YmgE (transglycosylase-associated protein family)